MPVLELTNAKFNSLYKEGKIYRVDFDDGTVYVGSTCESLETRLKWRLSSKDSQVFKNRSENPKIELISKAPSFDKKKSLEKTENEHIVEYAKKYGKKTTEQN